jgi:hypothetical protein
MTPLLRSLKTREPLGRRPFGRGLRPQNVFQEILQLLCCILPRSHIHPISLAEKPYYKV